MATATIVVNTDTRNKTVIRRSYKKKSDNTKSRTLSTNLTSSSNCVAAVSKAPVKLKSKKGTASSAEHQL